jgi:hypothetical protein
MTFTRAARGGSLVSPDHGVRRRREMLTWTSPAPDNANVCSLDSPPAVARRGAIRELASRHGLEAIRWWPPNDGDLLVEGLPLSLRQLRADLERALGCKVAIYLADRLETETRDRLRGESVDLLAP